MIRTLRLLVQAWRLAEAEYELHVLEREFDALGVKHADEPCRRCELSRPLEVLRDDARGRFIELRGAR